MRGSDDRALFLTGTRGCGKTALLEQFSNIALQAGWRTIDISSEHALQSLYRQLSKFDEKTETISPSVSAEVLGSGVSFSGVGQTTTVKASIDDLDQLLIKACSKEKKGVCVTIDEIQKIPLEDIAFICGAFQLASRKGNDVVLAVAGLPYSYERIIHHDGCTFMRRSSHEQINLLSKDEVKKAFASILKSIRGLKVTDEAFDDLVQFSSGHPYMMQLLGYQLIEYLNSVNANGATANNETISIIVPTALDSYEQRSLQPLLDELSKREREYLTAMANVSDSAHISRTGDIARALNKTAQQLSPLRKKLIGKGVIVSAGHGLVRFNIPYLRAFVSRPSEEHRNLEQLEEWSV